MGRQYSYDFDSTLTKKIMEILGIDERDDKGGLKRQIQKLVITLEAGINPYVSVYVEELSWVHGTPVNVSYTIPLPDDIENCKLPEVLHG